MKKILITGASGFIGRRLTERLLERGDQVTVLTRDASRLPAGASERVRRVAWTPDQPGPWTSELETADAVVHLAGEPVAQRWSPAVKERIRSSRVEGTRVLVEAMSQAARKPAVLVSASAIGYYGPRPSAETLDEDSAPGQGFLSEVVTAWEAEAHKAAQLGVRVVQLRIGVVLGDGGGALERMILPFKLFGGGPVGDGNQVLSWIHRDDLTGLILYALDEERVRGPLNGVAPEPATSAEFARALGAALHRPSWLPAPAFAIKLMMGEAAEIVTTGQRVMPSKALSLGYPFRYPSLAPALRSILGTT